MAWGLVGCRLFLCRLAGCGTIHMVVCREEAMVANTPSLLMLCVPCWHVACLLVVGVCPLPLHAACVLESCWNRLPGFIYVVVFVVLRAKSMLPHLLCGGGRALLARLVGFVFSCTHMRICSTD